MNPKNLEGILKWSLTHSDGTGPARQITDEERRWFAEAVEATVVDVVKRMKEITAVMRVPEDQLLEQGVTVDELAGMLEELQEHVESIDMANDLKPIGGLEPLLSFLRSPHAELRARAAEVVMTMVQNNERCQRTVMQAGGHLTLFDLLLSDPDATVRAKASSAVLSLVMHNEEGLAALRSVVGVSGFERVLAFTAQSSDTTQLDRLRRKFLSLFTYYLQQFPQEGLAAVQAGVLTAITSPEIFDSSSPDVRTAALNVVRELIPDANTAAAAAASQTSGGDVAGDATVKMALGAVNRRVDVLGEVQAGDGHEIEEQELESLLKIRKLLVEGKPRVIEIADAVAAAPAAPSVSVGAPLLLAGTVVL